MRDEQIQYYSSRGKIRFPANARSHPSALLSLSLFALRVSALFSLYFLALRTLFGSPRPAYFTYFGDDAPQLSDTTTCRKINTSIRRLVFFFYLINFFPRPRARGKGLRVLEELIKKFFVGGKREGEKGEYWRRAFKYFTYSV